MPLRIVAASKAELPAGATQGFKVNDGDETLMFFHWCENPVVKAGNYEYESGEFDGVTIENRVVQGRDGQPKMVHQGGRFQDGTAYPEVLAAVPDRLRDLGYEDETDALLGEIVGRFGAG